MKKNSRDIEFWCFINPIQAKVKGDSRKKKRFKWQLKKSQVYVSLVIKEKLLKFQENLFLGNTLESYLVENSLPTNSFFTHSTVNLRGLSGFFFFLVFVSFTGCQKSWAFHQDAFLSYVHNCIYCTFVDLSNTLSYRKEFH